jgi:hypothetical protein
VANAFAELGASVIGFRQAEPTASPELLAEIQRVVDE